MQYFENEWLKKNCNWFEAFAQHVPSTNNALEAFNRTIEAEHTFRERLDIIDISRFRTVLYKMLTTWSVEYESGLNTIENECPRIDTSLNTEAYNWANLKLKLTLAINGNYKLYRVPAGLTDIANSDAQSDAQTEIVNEWDSFDSFKATRMPLNIDKTNWTTGDCVDYYKNFMCMHVVGIAMRLKLIKAPP